MNKKIIFVSAIVLLIVISIVVYYRMFAVQNITLSINNEILEFNSEDTKAIEINLDSFNSEKDTIIKYIKGNANITVDGQKLSKNEELNLGKIKINEKTKILVDIVFANKINKKYIINTLSSDFPEYLVEGKSQYDGDYYMSTFSFDYTENHFIFKMNESGEILYYKFTGNVAFDFRKQTDEKGNIRYTYLESTANNFLGKSAILPCDLVIMDENYNELKRVNYSLEDGKSEKLENHAYIYFSDEHYILATYEKEDIKLREKLNCIIQEVKNGEIVWEFNSGRYPELYEYYFLDKTNLPEKCPDYMHINSMTIDKADGNLLCSFRNINSIIKINRNTGEIIWILGGEGDQFNLTENQKFSKQHSIVSSDNNTILIYDNGNKDQRSRMVKFKIDENNKKIENFTEYDAELYAPMMGSVQVINEGKETYLICYGGGEYTKYSIEEINYSENIVDFRFTFVDNPYMYNVNKIK